MANLEEELDLLFPKNVDERNWRLWASDAEDRLAQQVAWLVPGAIAVHGGRQRGDVVRSQEHSEALAIELKIWRFSPKNIGNRVAEMLSTAVLLRRDSTAEAHLGLLILFDVQGASGGFEDMVSGERVLAALQRLVRRDPHDAGFDRVVVGFVRGARGWIEINALEAPAQLHRFQDAVAQLTTRRKLERPPWPDSGSNVEVERGQVDVQSGPAKFLLFADEWRSRRGGISTFNRELAIALASARFDVRVVVPTAEQDERDEALASGVTLVTPDPIPGIEDHQLLLTRPRFLEGDYRPDAIIGHGRVLGPYAYAAHHLFFPEAKRLHIVHTDSERLEIAKRGLAGDLNFEAERRRELEVELALSADLVAGVGPLLAESIADAMRGARRDVPPVIDLRPGLRNWGEVVDPADPPRRRQVLLVARADDLRSKGIDIAASAVARAVSLFGTGVMDTPVLVIRGIPRSEAEVTKQRIDDIVAPDVEVVLRPYTSDPDALRRDLWQSRVVIMPSRHEGFGLVALEGISAGVPVLVSRESGLGRVLAEVVEDAERPFPREVLPVSASLEEAAEVWGDAIYDVLVDPGAAFLHSARLREELSRKVTWSRVVWQIGQELALEIPPE